MGKDKIYLSQKGYEQYLQELQDLRDQLTNNGKNKSDAFVSAVGDGWHDNFEFENAKREELRIQSLIENKVDRMKDIVIIEDKGQDSVISVDDYIDVEMTYPGENPENMIFKLVGASTPNFKASIQEVSLNSPLGKSVYEKKVGDNVNYEVNGMTVNVLINGKAKTIEELNNNSGVKIK